MKSIVWVDRRRSDIEQYIRTHSLYNLAKINPFENFMFAEEFIRESQQEIAIVISNYSTLSWGSVLSDTNNLDYATCFEFYDSIIQQIPKVKFILYSGIAEFDSKLPLYIKKQKFEYIPKHTKIDLHEYLKQNLLDAS